MPLLSPDGLVRGKNDEGSKQTCAGQPESPSALAGLTNPTATHSPEERLTALNSTLTDTRAGRPIASEKIGRFRPERSTERNGYQER